MSLVVGFGRLIALMRCGSLRAFVRLVGGGLSVCFVGWCGLVGLCGGGRVGGLVGFGGCCLLLFVVWCLVGVFDGLSLFGVQDLFSREEEGLGFGLRDYTVFFIDGDDLIFSKFPFFQNLAKAPKIYFSPQQALPLLFLKHDPPVTTGVSWQPARAWQVAQRTRATKLNIIRRLSSAKQQDGFGLARKEKVFFKRGARTRSQRVRCKSF